VNGHVLWAFALRATHHLTEASFGVLEGPVTLARGAFAR
jgi:hypothetical protein